MAGERRSLLAGGQVPDPHRAVLAAADALAPSAVTATDITAPSWPLSVACCWPAARSQTRTVPSSPPLTPWPRPR